MLLSDRDLLSRLVAFDTTSARPNLPAADFLCDYLDRPGVSIERQGGDDPSKVNVLVLAGEPDAAGGGLLLSGHLDVVPAGEDGWRSDPFTLTERDGTWVARGACDMKGFIALAVNVLAATDLRRLRRPLGLLLTRDEELGTLGAQHFARTWPRDRPLPRSVLVGEPTSLRAVRMHKGHLWMRVVVEGRSAHTGSPQLGVNAIEGAARVVGALVRLAGVFRQRQWDTGRFFPAVPFPVLSVSRIAGGSAVNVVPDRCVIDVGLRVLPGMSVESTVEWVRDAVVKSDPQGRLSVEVCNDSPPLLLDERAEINRVTCELLGQQRSYGVSFASDGGPLATRGFECLLFGPGSIEVAHRPNEFVPVDEFVRAREVLQQLVARLCT